MSVIASYPILSPQPGIYAKQARLATFDTTDQTDHPGDGSPLAWSSPEALPRSRSLEECLSVYMGRDILLSRRASPCEHDRSPENTLLPQSPRTVLTVLTSPWRSADAIPPYRADQGINPSSSHQNEHLSPMTRSCRSRR